MRAYKFRSSAQIQFALDILINRRLFCGAWKDMNDPMEGIFTYSTRGSASYVQQTVKGIGDAKSRYKICSLSQDFQSHLLWAHYAGGFDGIAIEVDLPDTDAHIKKVKYRDVFAFLDIDRITNLDTAAKTILFSKYREWKYEKEIRIMSQENFYDLPNGVSRVICGPRMHPALFEMLGHLCLRERIDFAKIGIGDEGIDADPVDMQQFSGRRRA